MPYGALLLLKIKAETKKAAGIPAAMWK